MSSLKFKIFFHFWISICVHTFLVESFGSPDWRYEACKPKNCGSGPNISYPFQIIENYSIDFCGYPGFEVECEDNKPLYFISNGTYIVEEIFYENESFRLVNIEVVNSTCPSPQTPFDLGQSSLVFGPNFGELHLFYHCNQTFPYSYMKNPITCASNETYKSFAVLDTGKEDINCTAMPCESFVSALVELEEGQQNQTVETMDYTMLLRNGFILEWSEEIGCRKCEKSGGRCGFSNRKVVCYCLDGEHSEHCNDETHRGLKMQALIAATAIGIALILVGIVFCFRRKYCTLGKFMILWKGKTESYRNVEIVLKNYGSLAPKRYCYSDVKTMTESFKVKLGHGGYGCVFSGKLPNGSLVAVKVLNESKGNGEEFINEVATITRTSHVNIVTLLGFCFEGSKRALIYEFMPNGSLEKFIYNESSLTECQLGWEKLYEIAIGIARGLEYLHRGCNTRILHFDIKPHNILLDEDFCPKISDFGLAKLCPRKESIISMLAARGTVGYIAPEVFCRNFGGVSHKSDVYSYGMMVLEMVGGRKNIEVGVDCTSEIFFPHWIYKQLVSDEELRLHGIVNEVENERARKMIITSLWCIQTDPSIRPSMTRVVDMLEGSLESLQIPPKPFCSSPSSSSADSLTKGISNIDIFDIL